MIFYILYLNNTSWNFLYFVLFFLAELKNNPTRDSKIVRSELLW